MRRSIARLAFTLRRSIARLAFTLRRRIARIAFTLRRRIAWRALTIALTSGPIGAIGACADPGADALDRVVRASESLTRIAEAHARGELRGPALSVAIGAWSRTDGAAIETLAKDAARALGPALRQSLAERWRTASEPLLTRLRAPSDEKGPPR